MKLLLYLILAHLVADFVLQSDQLVKSKNDYYKEFNKYISIKNPLLKHGILVLLSMQILHLFYDNSLLIILMTIIITTGHLLIDHKKLIITQQSCKNGLLYFSLEQFLHLLWIYFASIFFKVSYTQKYIWLFGSYKSKYNNGEIEIPDIDTYILGSIIILILFSIVAGSVISFILEKLKIVNNEVDVHVIEISNVMIEEGGVSDVQEEIAVSNEPSLAMSKTNQKIGIKIGIIERLLVIIFVAMGQYSAMGLILAVKSITRFEELKNKKKSEYYLLGTLLSFLFGILGGLLIKRLID
ncbi:DUF3307 domain-containing protein [Vallitalea guaymasensis]|uniref:DUF3307 domain-containing protein n=1 Tax=Vallitalea guaymasensis TaxID=1185412 RepID=A0A8J8M7F8_9FIRM|nr:DUF3307 domain-containing protein [Vallitalea guaymasensis]QUH27560.1 DUF3307 domain-containing protein [Vallitalea guaymasensis]